MAANTRQSDIKSVQQTVLNIPTHKLLFNEIKKKEIAGKCEVHQYSR